MSNPAELVLKDILDIPESVHAGQFKVELSGGFDATRELVGKYVVTDQLQDAFRRALAQVRDALQGNESLAAYLHGSFGSGKSHFMTVLHAVLDGHDAVVDGSKPKLREVYAEHAGWLRGKKFMMVPYHLVGATDLDSKILGGYAAAAQRLGLPTPPVYRSDALLDDARRQRKFLKDDARFVAWLGTGAPAEADPDDVAPIGGVSGWTGASLDAAFDAPPGSPEREALVTALLSGPLASYAAGQRGARDAFLPLENGLAVMSRHARQHGFDGLVLFIDELILWLQAHMSNQEMVNDEVSKLVKLIESEDPERGVPIVSFISRQRDLTQLVGDDVMGAEVKNLERQVAYLAGRFQVISLEDRNLPAIIKERVLKPRPGMAGRLDAAFSDVESNHPLVKDVLLDSQGATHADWRDFRDVYPLSPALLNVLVALSGALQRERTGLKLLSEMLRLRRDDLKVGQIIPLGDLWDVLSSGIGEAFSDRLRHEAEAATRFHARVRANLLEEYGSEDDDRFRADDRLVKTLILSALAPDVTALTRLTGARLAALNLGSVRSRATPVGDLVGSRLKRLISSGFGEIRADGDLDPVFTLHLTDLNVEPILDLVGGQDHAGARRIWIKEKLWECLGVKDSGAFVCERELVWRGSRRTAEFVFENVRDAQALRDEQFTPSVEGRIRFVIDYPFDVQGKYPSDDAQRVEDLRRAGHEADTLVWLPDHLSAQREKQLGRLLKINYLLERDRLRDYTGDKSSDEQARIASYLAAQQDTLTNELTVVLQQLYGVSSGAEGNVGVEVLDGKHVLSLNPAHPDPRLEGGGGFEFNLEKMADGLFSVRYPRHPDFDTAGNRKAVTPAELKTALRWITQAMEDGERRVVVDRDKLPLLRRIVHPLELGQVHDGPLNVGTDWLRRIEQQAAQHGVTGDYQVEDIRGWIEDLGWTGMDRLVGNLVIATYALLSDRAWVYQGRPEPTPELDRIGAGWVLQDQAKPSDAEYAAARTRLAKIFGKTAPEQPFARNVGKLADTLRDRIDRIEKPVLDVLHELDGNATALGLAHDAPRLAVARQAAGLMAELSAAREDSTALARKLATAACEASDEELGSAIVSAPGVAEALRGVTWSLLEPLRGFAGREDDIGRSARTLVDRLAETANAQEFARPLAPVLTATVATAVTLITRAGKQAAELPPPPPPPPPPVRPEDTSTTPDQTSLTDDGSPPVSRAPRRRTVRQAGLDGQFDAVRADVRAYLDDHPGAEVEIVWQPVDRT
ncbi:PglY protein [Actinomadura craniellae]|uniref:PglY protein n=1 Tax=Actinomadura craniellae TaxID=2231787 RepID=A0A365H196_9ACTN|nr:DUF6079 family protein [Actinomadura craniellae]RAY12851.1 PglY protein [Actinomadura craniellae]